MKHKFISFIITFISLLFIPIYTNAIIADYYDLENHAHNFNDLKVPLLIILLIILVVDFIISIVTILRSKKKQNPKPIKFLPLLYQISLLVYLIGAKISLGPDTFYTRSTLAINCLFFIGASLIIQIVCIKCDTKLKKRLFIIFAILGFLAISAAIIIAGLLEFKNSEYIENYQSDVLLPTSFWK
jgi:lysylphosphatidylglycerol synthetase-like protein (DUF2156 family)